MVMAPESLIFFSVPSCASGRQGDGERRQRGDEGEAGFHE
jgi:hypothetical protein